MRGRDGIARAIVKLSSPLGWLDLMDGVELLSEWTIIADAFAGLRWFPPQTGPTRTTKNLGAAGPRVHAVDIADPAHGIHALVSGGCVRA